jgi:hypothetical protein
MAYLKNIYFKSLVLSRDLSVVSNSCQDTAR